MEISPKIAYFAETMAKNHNQALNSQKSNINKSSGILKCTHGGTTEPAVCKAGSRWFTSHAQGRKRVGVRSEFAVSFLLFYVWAGRKQAVFSMSHKIQEE
jgi:hypothetical protein